MKDDVHARLARRLLKDNGHLKEFEVDLLDSEATDLLVKALELMGCKIERKPSSTIINVVCPTD